MTLEYSRGRLSMLVAVAVTVALGTFLALVATGTLPTLALAFGLLAGLFTLVVVPLVVIAGEVGSKADDHEEIERRVAAGLGLTKTEFDASFEGTGRQGLLYELDEEDSE
ncbi:hypothetical protein [Halomarina litorea]|uniref:hypothetical protein n=1 Tax=Halomarina litorea TaxID=2961595 RepID=UPI0020C48B91|nr:hypothetical protein [Halomarina sp. BCD28]